MLALVALLVIVTRVASVADDKFVAASPTQYTPQEKVLAKEPYGNFACRVNSLKVTTENPGDLETPVVSAQDIRDSFEQLASVEWAHVMQASFSSMDGRNEEKLLSTPGGDMGEFIQAIAAYNKVTGKILSDDDVQRVFEKYLRVMTRSKFSYETDEKAYLRLAVATGCRNLRVADMGGMKHKKEAYLKAIADPDHIGDPFIRFLALNATDLEFPVDAVRQGLSAYHKVLWSAPSQNSQKLCYLEMKGAPIKEQALVHLRTEDWCVDQGLAPMISPQLSCPAPVFINHVDHVRLFRRELVSVMTDAPDTRDQARDVLAALNQLADNNLDKFWGTYGAGLPVYTVMLSSSAPVLSTDVSSFTELY